jgi:hypothetical protein
MDMGKVKIAPERYVERWDLSVSLFITSRGWTARLRAISFAQLIRENEQMQPFPGSGWHCPSFLPRSVCGQYWFYVVFTFYDFFFNSFFLHGGPLSWQCTTEVERHPQGSFVSWNQSWMNMWKYATFLPFGGQTRQVDPGRLFDIVFLGLNVALSVLNENPDLTYL